MRTGLYNLMIKKSMAHGVFRAPIHFNKKVEKNQKKYLTRAKGCDNINELCQEKNVGQKEFKKVQKKG